MAKVKFGDVVKEYKGKIDQKSNPYEFYVAGDHMDTDDLTIRRKGCFATDDVGPAFIREFKKGQVLYGSRRTYLRKIAVADFDGVTANTTFVLETKDEKVLRQRLLPFIMYTESFTEWSIKKSKGSTNPYVLFKDLADYEFELPNIRKQDELVELLWSMIDVKDAYNNLIFSIDQLVASQFIERFGDPATNPFNWDTMTMKEASQRLSDGPFGSNLKSSHYSSSGIRVIRLQNIGQGFFSDEDKAYIPESHYEKIKKYTCKAGDIVIGTLGEPNLRACIIPDSIPIAINKADCVHFIPKADLLVKGYVCAFLNNPATLAMAVGDIHGNTRQRISSGQLAQMRIMIPPIDRQKDYAEFVVQSDKSKDEIRNALAETVSLYKRIIQDNLTYAKEA